MLLYNMKELLPSADTAAAVGEDADGNPVEVACDAAAPTCAYVFKTVADPFVGKAELCQGSGRQADQRLQRDQQPHRPAGARWARC